MRRDAIEGASGSARAPRSGGGNRDAGRARTRRRGGIPMPSAGLAGMIVLAIVGLVAHLGDDPDRRLPPMRRIPGEPGTTTVGFAISPDGQTIATTRSDRRLSLRVIRGIARILDFPGYPSGGLAFSPDGRFLAMGRKEPGIPIFDIDSGRPPIILDAPIAQSRALAFSPDGRTLAATTERDGSILLWDFVAGRARLWLRGSFPAVDIAFSPDGRTLAVGEKYEKRVTLWDLLTGRSRTIFREASRDAITSVAFSSDGSLVAAAGSPDRLVRVWDPASGQLRHRIVGHSGGTNAVRFAPDGGRLVTAGSDEMVRIWKVETGEAMVCLDGRALMVPKVFVSADSRMVAAAGTDNAVRMWDLDEIDETRVDRAHP